MEHTVTKNRVGRPIHRAQCLCGRCACDAKAYTTGAYANIELKRVNSSKEACKSEIP